HNVGRARASLEAALQSIQAKTLVIGISHDLLFPINEQEYLAAHIPGAQFKSLSSFYGHDGFLLEYAQLSEAIEGFLSSTNKENKLKTLIS
ncbi:MAG: homoserine O-acetyltransferase, partial [Bacteroidota bacterium]